MFIITFFLLIGFKFNFLPGFINDTVNIIGLSIVFYIFFIKQIRISHNFKNIIVIEFIILLLALISYVINDVLYISYTKFSFKLILYTLYAYSLVLLYRNIYQKEYDLQLLKHFYYALVLHAVIILLMLIFPEFKSLIYSISDVSKLMFTHIGDFRIAGFSGGGGALLSVVQASAILLSLYLLEIKQLELNKALIYNSFILISILLTGRTGFLVLIIFLSISFFFSRPKKIFAVKDKLLSFFYLCLLLGVIVYIFSSIDVQGLIGAYDRLMSQFEDNGKKKTVDILLDMIFFPEQLNNMILFLFGTASNGRDIGMWLYSDIGYLKLLFMSGFIGLLLTMSLFLYLIISVIIKSNVYKFKKYFLLFLVTLIFIHFKENFLYNRHTLLMIFVFYFTVIFKTKDIYEKNII